MSQGLHETSALRFVGRLRAWASTIGAPFYAAICHQCFFKEDAQLEMALGWWEVEDDIPLTAASCRARQVVSEHHSTQFSL